MLTTYALYIKAVDYVNVYNINRESKGLYIQLLIREGISMFLNSYKINKESKGVIHKCAYYIGK